MSPAYRTAEQFDRWHKRTCARCGRFGCFAAVWPDGPVCRTCECRALRIRGRCPECDEQRILPGVRSSDGTPICTRCANFSPSYACSRCGQEDQLHARRLCSRCTLSDRITGLLDDGTGRIRPELHPLHDLLVGMDNPKTGLTWLDGRSANPGAAAQLLRGLGNGDIELTHEAFHRLDPWRAAAHLRELLMKCGVLPAVDKQVCSFERWLVGHLAAIPDPGHTQIVRRFATWEVLPRLRRRANERAITPAGRRFAGDRVKHATAFLGWLAARDLDLSTCRQADIDVWHFDHNDHARNSIRAFLQWCAQVKLTPAFTLPSAVLRTAVPLPQAERRRHLRRLLTDVDIPLRVRVAGVIVLLYAQPVSRIVRLTVDDVIIGATDVRIRLGEPPSPVPEAAATLLLSWIADRDNMNTATNHRSRWIFPGRRAGQPMHPDALAALINDIGIPTTAGRTAAIRQHLLELPAPVVADALGYHHVTTTRIANTAGKTWSRYAPGDHDPLHPPTDR